MPNYFLLYGQPNSGKKSLKNRLLGNDFTSSYLDLAGMDKPSVTTFSQANIQIETHSVSKWDTTGIPDGKFNASKQVLICISAEDDIDGVRKLIEKAKDHMKRGSNTAGAPIIVITKADSPKRKFSKDDIQGLEECKGLLIIETDSKRANVKEDFFNSVPLENISLKQKFKEKHTALLEKSQQSGISGLFRRTKIDYKQSISQLVEHAQKKDNRSRQAFVELGWMDEKGEITNDKLRDEVNNESSNTLTLQ